MSSTSNPISQQQQWRLALPIFLLLLTGLGYLYFDTAKAIVSIWMRSETFTHGFVVPPIVVWLIWRQRQALSQLTPTPNATALVLIAGAAFAWLLGDLATIDAVMQLAFVSMVILLVPALLGLSVARAIAFPLVFLFFAVPIGEFAMPQLMEWTADFTVLALRLTGIPVFREGLQFVIPSGNWSVVEACSGVRYLIASLTVGTLFAYLNYQSTGRRVIFIAVSLVVPIVANWLRAYLIVLLGHLSGNKLAAGVDHLIYGWIFFGVVIMLMFMIGARWSEPEPGLTATNTNSLKKTVAFSSFRIGLTAGALVVIFALPGIALRVIEQSDDTAAALQLVAPQSLSQWSTVSATPGLSWQPAFHNPSAQLNTIYKLGDQAVGVYLGYFHHQGPDRKLVSSENALVKSKDPHWAQVSSGVRSIDLRGKSNTVRTAELRGSASPGQAADERLTVWQIYWINGTLTSSDILAKAYTALYSLMGRGDDSAVIIVYAPKRASGQAEATLTAFMQANASVIDALLRNARPK
jgi:exosortase A